MELTSLVRAAKSGAGSAPEISLAKTFRELNHTRAALSDLKGQNRARYSGDVTTVAKQVGTLEKMVYEDKIAEAKRVSGTVSNVVGYENKVVNKVYAQILGTIAGGLRDGSNLGTFIDRYA